MNVIACYKIVPDEQDIVVNGDRTLSLDKAALKVGQYDLNAVEAGAQLAEASGGKLTVLSAGGAEAENSKMKKSILSRGPQENFVCVSPVMAGADAGLTAKVLCEAVKKMEGWDLVLCGEGSSDLYSQQVGIQLGERLGLPTLNAVSKITDAGDKKVIVERSLEDEVEVIEVGLPAVLSVTSDINITRVPTMKEILAAGKKPTTVWKEGEIPAFAPLMETVSVLAPQETERKCVVVEGDDGDKIAQFCQLIKAELQ